MINALLSGVTGLKAHQTMLDVAGNNLSNVNTTGYKDSQVSFSSMLSDTLRDGAAPTAALGGTNPMQIGNGVRIAAIARNMSQGSLVNTGNPLDIAIEGAGYFTLHDGQQELYTRVGAFAVDSDYYLVDPSTGYRVQRIGDIGVSEGFQNMTDNSIRIPYDKALAAQETTQLRLAGNLSADAYNPSRQILSSEMEYTQGESVVNDSVRFDQLDQAVDLDAADTLTVTGTRRDGSDVDVTIDLYNAGESRFKTIREVFDEVDAEYANPADASDQWSSMKLVNGEMRLEDAQAGYSQTDILLTYNAADSGTLELPTYFKIIQAGGEATKQINMELFDLQGNSHQASAFFVKQDAQNQWDLVLGTISGGGVKLDDRRIRGISFLANGSFAGMNESIGDDAEWRIYYPNDIDSQRTVSFDFGDVGEFGGLTQFGGPSTAAPSSQNGYAAGWLSSLSVGQDGVLVGVFTNGVRIDVAALKLATFRNPAGLKDEGDGYFTPSANSGDPVPSQALEGGTGTVHGGSLEKSNVDVAAEFVHLIEAQNGFQANARTITISNEVLQELSQLIR